LLFLLEVVQVIEGFLDVPALQVEEF
jgi:hypothetical protein